MGRLPVALLTLLCLAPAAITALPPQEHPSSPSPWRWFTNTLISKIWQLPDPQSPVRTTPDGNGRTENSQAAARYGQDIVLRFNLSSVDEAQAIADAAQDLYLDIWEFNENWVDIRLAKDIVRFHSLKDDGLQTADCPPRFLRC
jgi:extracellular matrix protein 14